VLGWLHKFGVEFFTELDIWRVDWAASSTDSAFAEEIRKHQRKHEGAPAPLSSQARRHMLAASHCLSQRDLAGCRVAIESALAEAPNHPEIISALATLLLKMGNASEACERLEGLLADHPSHLRSWIQLATANIKLGNDQGAVVALHRALNVDRNNVEAWRLLAEYQAASGRSAEAIVAYRAVSQLAPQDAGVQAELARILVGTGDVNEARQAGERDTIANLPPVDSPQISSAAVKAT
jgi:cytochrome c-type biogenesis protein CcmH/NrfG